MYVERIPNRNSNPTWLIRESKWINGRSVKLTIANISKLPKEAINGIRILLKGGGVFETLEDAFDILSNRQHGQVAAVLEVMDRLQVPDLIAPRNSRFRRLVLGMIAARVIDPCAKLATSIMLDARTATTTLNEELGLKRVDEDDLYEAMDELVKQKQAIECRLAQRHLNEGGLVLYDVTSSYVKGKKNEWAAYGYNRDKKRGKKQIVIGLMTDKEGVPVSVEVFRGNTADTSTLAPQIQKIQQTFGLKQVVLVGDRGILKQKQIQELPVGLDWITAMQKNEIRKVVEKKDVQMSLFDEQDLVEVFSDLYPGERLVLCRNPLQAEKSKQKREKRLADTEAELDKIVHATQRQTHRLKDPGKIGIRVGRVLARKKTKKFFDVEDIQEEHFSFARKQDVVAKAERLDGMYAIRSSLTKEPEAAELVTDYKRLSLVEVAFRTMKSFSLKVRPIHHRKKDRVTAHVLICMLAYYVEMHLRRRLAPLLLAEDDPEGKKAQRQSVVETAQPSPSAKKKIRTKQTETGEKALSFHGVMKALSAVNRVVVKQKEFVGESPEVTMFENMNATQHQAFKLLKLKLQ